MQPLIIYRRLSTVQFITTENILIFQIREHHLKSMGIVPARRIYHTTTMTPPKALAKQNLKKFDDYPLLRASNQSIYLSLWHKMEKSSILMLILHLGSFSRRKLKIKLTSQSRWIRKPPPHKGKPDPQFQLSLAAHILPKRKLLIRRAFWVLRICSPPYWFFFLPIHCQATQIRKFTDGMYYSDTDSAFCRNIQPKSILSMNIDCKRKASVKDRKKIR